MCNSLWSHVLYAARQTPLSIGFSRQEHWSELPCPPPEDLPNLGINPGCPALQADSLPSEPPGNTEDYEKKLDLERGLDRDEWRKRGRIVHMTSKVAITDTCRLAHWSGVPFRSPGDLLVSGIEPRSSTLQADSLWSETPRKHHPCIDILLKCL